MEAQFKLLVLLLVFSFLTSAFGAKKDDDDAPVGKRRWDDESLDEGDLKPRRRMTRLNVNFRRAGKKPRVRVHGPPLQLPSPSLVPSSKSYLANPFLPSFSPESPFFPNPYLPMMPGASKEWPFINAMKKSIGAPPVMKPPRPYVYLPVSPNELMLAKLLAKTLAENNIKPSDLLLANYQSTLEDAGVIPPSPLKPISHKENESAKAQYLPESAKSTYYPYKDMIQSPQTPYTALNYPSPNYPSPYTFQEVSQYREFPSPYYYEREMDFENPYAEYLTQDDPSFAESPREFQYEDVGRDYPADVNVRRKGQGSLENHKVE